MTWRQVTKKNIKDLQSFSLVTAVLLGAALTWHPPAILNGDTTNIHAWGVLLFVCSMMGILGEIWYGYSESTRRWVLIFGAHVALTAIYSALGIYSVLCIGPEHPGALVLAILFTEAAWLHRAFVHWKSDVSD